MVDIATAAREAESVRKATSDELPRLAAALARAMHDDAVSKWMVPDEARRRRLLEPGFELLLRKVWFEKDESYTTDGIAGACVWERPGEWKMGVVDQLRLFPAMARVYLRALPRVMRGMAAFESNHPERLHYYLPMIGVDPEWQGRGIGSALMRPVLARCDSERMPAYLEASTPRNRALYERHGFVVTEEFRLGKDSPPVWRMWREPAG